MKKTLLIIVAISSILNIFLVLQYFTLKRQDTTVTLQTPYKAQSFPIENGFVRFEVPQDWNAYAKGDSVNVDNLDEISSTMNAVFSISAPNTPVTYNDINWTQLDFYIANSNLLDDQTVSKLKKPTSGLRIESWTNTNFEVFSRTELLPEGTQPSKDQPGGTIFYVKPKVGKSWNLFINQQSIGDEKFALGVKRIIDTLTFEDQDFDFLQNLANQGLTYDEAKNLPQILIITPVDWTSVANGNGNFFFPKSIKIQPRTLSQQEYLALGPVGFTREQLLIAADKAPIEKQLQMEVQNIIRFIPSANPDENQNYTFGDEITGMSFGSIPNSKKQSLASWFRAEQYLPVVDVSMVKAMIFNGNPGLIVAYGVDQLNLCAYVTLEDNVNSYCFGGDVPPERMKDYLPLLEEIVNRSSK